MRGDESAPGDCVVQGGGGLVVQKFILFEFCCVKFGLAPYFDFWAQNIWILAPMFWFRQLVRRTGQWTCHLPSCCYHLQRTHWLRPGRHCNQGSGNSINRTPLLLRSFRGPIQHPSLPSSFRSSSMGSLPMLGPSSMASVSEGMSQVFCIW